MWSHCLFSAIVLYLLLDTLPFYPQVLHFVTVCLIYCPMVYIAWSPHMDILWEFSYTTCHFSLFQLPVCGIHHALLHSHLCFHEPATVFFSNFNIKTRKWSRKSDDIKSLNRDRDPISSRERKSHTGNTSFLRLVRFYIYALYNLFYLWFLIYK